MWRELGSVQCSGTSEGFLRTLDLLVNKPHVVNRRLCGTKELLRMTLLTVSPFVDLLPSLDLIAAVRSKCGSSLESSKENILQCFDGELSSSGISCELQIIIRDLLPKQIDRFKILREIIVLDKRNLSVLFIPFKPEVDNNILSLEELKEDKGDFPYIISFIIADENKRISLKVPQWVTMPQSTISNDSLACTQQWLKQMLLPKLARWSCEPALNTKLTSLTAISVEKYNQVYHYLKEKYGRMLLEMWPEKTDPQKFVFEDFGIAAYLLVLWQEERSEKKFEQKQSFVDLGCGNGLLVYLLSCEGHNGLGIDVRSRKIWELYRPAPNLQVRALTPSDSSLFPDYDWLIGNHSDELTPWIPVIAARSSWDCGFFVLPCCAWDFAGKFNSKVAGMSQYGAYLGYIRRVAQTCGFNVQEDVLRIPSTKRACLFGRSRTYQPEDSERVFLEVRSLIESCPRSSATASKSSSKVDSHVDCNHSDESDSDFSPDHVTLDAERLKRARNATHDRGSVKRGFGTNDEVVWSKGFQARSAVENSRNCLSVDFEVKKKIIGDVFRLVLSRSEEPAVTEKTLGTWNAGGTVPLLEVSQLFDRDILQLLKNECGGLQTLLRNAHDVFLVCGGTVRLRDWTSSSNDAHQANKRKKQGRQATKRDALDLRKTKLCYFYVNHPQGCPLQAKDCRFAHGDHDLCCLNSNVNQVDCDKINDL